MKTSSGYQKQFFQDWEHFVDARTRKVLSFLAKEKPTILLDIGCGNGFFSKLLIYKGWKCIGLEFCEKPAKEAKKEGLDILISDVVEGLPFQRDSFDYVYAGEIIEHCIDDDFFLKECRRVLKSQGVLILTTPNLLSLGNRILMSMGKMPRFAYAPFHHKIYNLQTITTKIQEAGFKVELKLSSYLLISRVFNRLLGALGEFLGNIFPSLGEHLILVSRKT